MNDPINFLAACEGKFAYFAISEDPVGAVADMQPYCPLPIELVAGWVVAPHLRARVQQLVMRQLRDLKVADDAHWFAIDPEQAAETLAEHAEGAGGKAWRRRRYRSTDAFRSLERARAIITPYGRFGSAAEAGRACGISRAAASQRALRRSPGWRYADDPRPQPELPPLGRPPLRDDSDDED